MDGVLQALLRERDALRARLEKIEASIAAYELWASDAAGLVGATQGADGSPGDTGHQPGIAGAAGLPQSSMKEFEEAVDAILTEAEAPYRRGPMLEALRARGVVVGGKDPLNTVASRLSRMETVKNLKGHGYWLERRPYGPAGYPGSEAGTGADHDRTESAEEPSSLI